MLAYVPKKEKKNTFQWKDPNKKIKERLNSEEIKKDLANLRSKIEHDNISNKETITLFKDICINMSDKSFKKVKFAGQRNNKERNFQEWFDDDCKKHKKKR